MTNEEIACRIDVLRPQPGDMLVVSVAARLTKEQVEHIKRQIEPLVPNGVKTAILDEAVSLTHVVAPKADA